jgi:hypothetical protein
VPTDHCKYGPFAAELRETKTGGDIFDDHASKLTQFSFREEISLEVAEHSDRLSLLLGLRGSLVASRTYNHTRLAKERPLRKALGNVWQVVRHTERSTHGIVSLRRCVFESRWIACGS